MKSPQSLWVLENPEDDCLEMPEGVWLEMFGAVLSEACRDHISSGWCPQDDAFYRSYRLQDFPLQVNAPTDVI